MTKILFSRELHARVKDYEITTYSFQSGVVNTELSRHSYRGFRISLMFSKLYGLTPIQGAQTSIYCVFEPVHMLATTGMPRNCGNKVTKVTPDSYCES